MEKETVSTKGSLFFADLSSFLDQLSGPSSLVGMDFEADEELKIAIHQTTIQYVNYADGSETTHLSPRHSGLLTAGPCLHALGFANLAN